AGWRIGTPGGLTGGTTLARILSRFERGNNAYGSAEYLDRLLHAFSDAFAARYAELGDDNAAEAPDAARSGAMAGSISGLPPRGAHRGSEPLGTSTTHLAVADAEGTVVSCTQTLLAVFGS